MKQYMKNVVLGSSTLLAIGAIGHVAQAATDDVDITAVIIAPLDITAVQALNFGAITDDGLGGTVTIDNLGAASSTGGSTPSGGSPTAGGFTLKGAATEVVEVTAPATVNITNGTAQVMAVGSFTIDGVVASAATPYVHTMVAATDTGFDLGGTVTVGAGQASGTYTGSVTLTALYQ